MEHYKRAKELFEGGYNCAQAVAMAFCDLTGQSEEFIATLTSPFGGGIGRMREVCGAVSGMYMVLGMLYGYPEQKNDEKKEKLYASVQELAEGFKRETGSIICRELLRNPPSDPTPTKRSAEFYASRPCTRMVMLAAMLLDEFIEKQK